MSTVTIPETQDHVCVSLSSKTSHSSLQFSLDSHFSTTFLTSCGNQFTEYRFRYRKATDGFVMNQLESYVCSAASAPSAAHVAVYSP